MTDLSASSRRLSASQVVLLILGMLLAVVLANCVTGMILNREPEAVEAMQAEAARARPLIGALETYRAAHGLYPPNLAALPRRAVPAPLLTDFLYSGQDSDRVLRSAACQERWNGLHGWIMQSADIYQRRLDDFAADCVVGRHDYTLQSADFRLETHANIERWAFYRSFTKTWTIGWCMHNSSMHGPPTNTVRDGICRRP